MSEQESEDGRLFVACPRCVSFAPVESADAGEDTAHTHNLARHDGEDITMTLNTRDEADLREFMQACKQRARGDEYTNLIQQLWRGDAPFVCPAKLFRKVVPEQDQQY